jgi:hypothetical protein
LSLTSPVYPISIHRKTSARAGDRVRLEGSRQIGPAALQMMIATSSTRTASEMMPRFRAA